MLLSTVITLVPAAPQQAPAWVARAAHAWLLERIGQVDPALGHTLHEADSVRPFTVSNLWGTGRAQEGQVALHPERPCWLRVTALTEAMGTALERALPSPGDTLDLAGARLTVQAVAADAAEHPWAGRSSYAGLLQERTLAPGPTPRGVALRFSSPTCFRSGGRDLPLPLPSLVFDGWLRKWNAFSPLALPEEAKRYAEECVALGRFRVRSHWVGFEAGDKGGQVGFTGEVGFRFLTGDAYWARVMTTLAAYAFWAGTGYRTTAGLGQTQAI